MAILKNLIVNGSSRFLNTAYFQDVSIDSLSLSGNLSVTGTSTLTGHVSIGGYNNASYGLSASSAIINSWIRTTGSTGWYNESHGGGWYMTDNNYVRSYGKPVMMGHNMFFGSTSYYVHTDGAANFSTVSSSTANIATLNANNASVTNNLHASHFDLQTVAQLGGSFYVSPTLKFPNSGTKLAVSKSSTQLTLTIKDSSISTGTMAGIAWTSGSAVKVSGTINGVVTGTMDGTIDSITNGSQMVVKVSGGNWNSVQATTTDLTANEFSDLTVMVYQRHVGSSDYRVGIWMNCYDHINSSSTIRVYGGTATNPTVTIGNLTGMTFNGNQIEGTNNWGILTSMGYFEGAIISNEGQIGGWTIDENKLFNGTDSMTSTVPGTYIGAGTTAANSGIRNYASSTQYVNITGGKITALGADIRGEITATSGTIGGVTANSSYGLYTNSKTSATSTNTGFLISKDGAIYLGAYNSTNKACPFQVTSAGALTATSGKIGGWTIGASSLYNTTNSMTSTGVGVYLGTDGIRNYASGTQYVNITGGKITALGVDVSGKITATSGAIGGFDITSTAIKTKDVAVTSNADNSISLSSADFTRTINSTSREGLRFAIGDKFGVTGDGIIYASSAHISGTLTAGNGSKIGDLTIADGKLSVPAANITDTLSADHIDASGLTIGQSQVTGLSTALGNKADSSTVTTLSNKVTAVYGTSNPSSTNASEQVKVVTCSNFELFSGALITVRFSYANAYASGAVQLNVNSKGAKDIWVANAVTSTTNQLRWGAGAVITFRYNGSAFIVVGEPREWYGTCSTAAGTYGKVSTDVTGCVICKGTIVSLSMTNDNTATSPSLNIVYTGSIDLYAGNGTTRPTTANGFGWTAGSTVAFVFDGQYWRVGDTASLARAHTAQTTATNAAKTATNYISTIGSTGINVSYATNAKNYLQITGDGVSIYKDIDGTSTQIANYGSSIILGKLAADTTHVEIDSDSFDVCSGAATGANSTKLATFGTTITLGQIANGVTRIQIDNDSFDVISRTNGTDTTIATFGTTVTLGNTSVQHIVINDTSFSFNDGDNIQMQIDSSGFHFGEEDSSGDLIDDIQFGVSQSGIIFKNKIFDEYYKPEVFSVNITDTELHQYTVTRQYQYTKGDSDMQFDERRGNIYELGTFLKGITPQVYLSYYKQNSDLSIVVENTELLDSSYYTYGFDEVYEDTDEDSPEYGYKGPRAWVIFNSSGISAINSKLSSYSTAHSWPYNTGFYDIHFNVTTKDPPSANLDMYGDLNVKSRVYLEGSDIREEGGNIICREIANEDGITLGSIKDTMQFVNAQWISATAVVASGASGTAKGTFTKVNNATGYIAIPISTYEWNICTSNPVISGTNISAGVKNISSGQHTCAVRILVLGYKWAN